MSPIDVYSDSSAARSVAQRRWNWRTSADTWQTRHFWAAEPRLALGHLEVETLLQANEHQADTLD